MTAIPETVRSAVVSVCKDAFHWRSDVRAVFLTAGVDASLYDRYDTQEAMSKPKVARAVLGDLQRMGAEGERIQRAIVEELCRMDRPRPDAPDPVRGQQALADLKREATTRQILVDPEKAAADQRRARERQRIAAEQLRRDKLGTLTAQFIDLARQSHSNSQARGYAFEKLLADLFDVYDIEYRRPYRTPREQLDGSFNFRGFTYIVEAKWEQSHPTFSDLATFKSKVDGKLESTRGLFVAMAGFDEAIVSHLQDVARGSRSNIILVDRQDLIEIFEGRATLPDALLEKINAAEQEGRCWYPLGR